MSFSFMKHKCNYFKFGIRSMDNLSRRTVFILVFVSSYFLLMMTMLNTKDISFSIGFANFYSCVENHYKIVWFSNDIKCIFQIKKGIE